jgi:alpha-galactosidase
MKTLRYDLPSADGALSSWKLTELLDLAEAGAEARSAFAEKTIMLQAGGWQSWSPGWELAPGQAYASRVRLIPLLRKLYAAPWDCGPRGNAPRGPRAEASGSFVMYLRAASWYLVFAAGPDNTLPLVFYVSGDRQLIRLGVYTGNEMAANGSMELKVFLAQGYFAFKDAIKEIYACEDRFGSLRFLGSGTPGSGFRPGGYASWYNHYTNINEKIILSDLEGLLSTENLIALRFLRKGQPAVFQIDDGWERAVGEWEIDGAKFPRGLNGIAERIENSGLVPGIWLAPFVVTRRSRIFRERPDWLLRDGRPVKAGWNPHWDGAFFCLDTAREDVLDYLRSLMNKIIDEWGFRFIKLDFLYAGWRPGHYERAVTLLTERGKNSAGLPLAYLGCGLPLGSSFRHFPLSRIGTDTRETWDWPLAKFIRHEGRPSAVLSLLDTIGRSFMNGTVYINDPDVVFLRSENCSLKTTEKECIALVNFLFASQIMCSDNFLSLTRTDLSFAKRINGLYDALAGDEYGPSGLARKVFLLESRSGKITGLINLSDKSFFYDADGRFSGAAWLVDHRLPAKGRLCFAPRSVSIARVK